MLSRKNYKIEVRICSEAVFSSGEKERNLVHRKVLTDRYGLVYFHAKTFKGQLKRQAFWLLRQYQRFDFDRAKFFFKSIAVLFGINGEELEILNDGLSQKFSPSVEIFSDDEQLKMNNSGQNRQYFSSIQGIMKLSALELDERVRNYFITLQSENERNEYYRISPHDLIEAQTNIRTGIQLEQGKARDKRLTTYHTVKEGLVFYSRLLFDADPKDYLCDLKRIVHSLDRIGAGVHRGRGEVEACLLEDGREVVCAEERDKEGERRAVL